MFHFHFGDVSGRLFEALKVRERSKRLRKLCKEYQKGLKHSEIITGHCETSYSLNQSNNKRFQKKKKKISKVNMEQITQK